MINYFYKPYDDDPTKYYKVLPTEVIAGHNLRQGSYFGSIKVYFQYDYIYSYNRFNCRFRIVTTNDGYSTFPNPGYIKITVNGNEFYTDNSLNLQSDIINTNTFYINCNDDGSVDDLDLKIEMTIYNSSGGANSKTVQRNLLAFRLYTSLKYKILNVWKTTVAKIKVNNIWKRCIVWKKINGEWKKGK